MVRILVAIRVEVVVITPCCPSSLNYINETLAHARIRLVIHHHLKDNWKSNCFKSTCENSVIESKF